MNKQYSCAEGNNVQIQSGLMAPIALFVYNRPDHTRRTVEALRNNLLVSESDLIIFSDGPKTIEVAEKVEEVRKYLVTITGFRSVKIYQRNENFGLAKSIINGVAEIVNKYGRIIVLEDDMVTSPYFLTYMNEALDKYANDDRVISIHGYVYPVKEILPEAFFLPGADCWGWATWQRGWALFNPDGQYLLNELHSRKLTRQFSYNGTYPLLAMLKGQIEGKNDSWAIRWFASAFLASKLTLYPSRSLVHNIGNDSSGTHCGSSNSFDVVLADKKIELENVRVEVSLQAKSAFENYFKQQQVVGLRKVFRKISKLLWWW